MTPNQELSPLGDRTLRKSEWLAVLEDLGEERGYYEPLGKRHSVVLSDESAILVVTFETIADIRKRGGEPLGWQMTRKHGWSNLCLISDGDTWFRDPGVYGYFDRLVDDGFFEDFDHVIFFGVGPCGYAATAYSVVAPGATVIAVSPQASLDPACCAWDRRFPRMRRTSFSDRYGYAPDMIEAADQVFVIYDPEVAEDAMHAALFSRPNVTRLRSRGHGLPLKRALPHAKILPRLCKAAIKDKLKARLVQKTLRLRRDHMPYLRQVLRQLEDAGRERLTLGLCNSVTARLDAPDFREARQKVAQQVNTLEVV